MKDSVLSVLQEAGFNIHRSNTYVVTDRGLIFMEVGIFRSADLEAGAMSDGLCSADPIVSRFAGVVFTDKYRRTWCEMESICKKMNEEDRK